MRTGYAMDDAELDARMAPLRDTTMEHIKTETHGGVGVDHPAPARRSQRTEPRPGGGAGRAIRGLEQMMAGPSDHGRERHFQRGRRHQRDDRKAVCRGLSGRLRDQGLVSDRQLPQPVIAAVAGYALGAVASLRWCDIVIADTTARSGRPSSWSVRSQGWW